MSSQEAPPSPLVGRRVRLSIPTEPWLHGSPGTVYAVLARRILVHRDADPSRTLVIVTMSQIVDIDDMSAFPV